MRREGRDGAWAMDYREEGREPGLWTIEREGGKGWSLGSGLSRGKEGDDFTLQQVVNSTIKVAIITSLWCISSSVARGAATGPPSMSPAMAIPSE